MSASKFANLEGVDLDAPDVFESGSPDPTGKGRSGARGGYGSSDDDQDDSEAGEEDGYARGDAERRKNRKVGQAGDGAGEADNADIVRRHLNVDEASKRFRDAAGVDANHADFSTALRRQKKAQFYPRPAATFETRTYSLVSGTGYRATTDDDDDVDGGTDEARWRRVEDERESAVDKFRRLRFEMEELEKELATQKLQGSAPPLPGKKEQDDEIALLPQLSVLREHLSEMEEKSNLSRDGSAQRDVAQWQAEARKLVQGLSIAPRPTGAAGTTDAQLTTTEADGSRPSVQLSSIDKRLAGLETLIGIQVALHDESSALPRPLLPALARIEHLLTLLTQPRHLDGISRRIKVLVSELERVHEARRKLVQANEAGAGGGGHDRDAGTNTVALPAETVKRLDGVLPLLSKVEPLLPIVPTLLSRLHSLAILHANSAAFAHDVESAESVLRATKSQNDELHGMLRNLEVSLTENEKRTKDNLALVEERMERILKRMDALAQ